MRIFSLGIALGVSVLAHSAIAGQERPDLTAIFNRNYHAQIDRLGTVSRTAYDDATGRVIGIQIGTYRTGKPNGMTVESIYVEPTPGHPGGQVFDSKGRTGRLHFADKVTDNDGNVIPPEQQSDADRAFYIPH